MNLSINQAFHNGPPGLVVFLGFWVLLVTAAVHISFAVGVFSDATARRTQFVGPVIWSLATLIGGPFVAVAYWVIHLSSLSITTKTSAPIPELPTASAT